MELGELVGWLGVLTGLLVAPPQLIKIIRSKSCEGISKLTYLALVAAIAFYLLHAIYIESVVFMVAQSINLTTNSLILFLVFRGGNRGVQPRA